MRTKYQRVVMANQQKKGFLCEDRIFSSPVCQVGTNPASPHSLGQNQTHFKPTYVCLFQNEHPGPDSFGLISSTVVESPCFATEGNQVIQTDFMCRLISVI